MSSSRFFNYHNSCLTFLCFSFLLAAKFPQCQQLFVQYTIYNWVYWMRTENNENISEIFNPNIFHWEMIFTSDEPHKPHWQRNMCNSVTKNSAETNTKSSSILDISQNIKGVGSTSIFIWTNSFHVFVLFDQRSRYFIINYSHKYCWNEINEEYPKCTVKFHVGNVHDLRLYKASRQTHPTSYNQPNKVHQTTNDFQFPSTDGRF